MRAPYNQVVVGALKPKSSPSCVCCFRPLSITFFSTNRNHPLRSPQVSLTMPSGSINYPFFSYRPIGSILVRASGVADRREWAAYCGSRQRNCNRAVERPRLPFLEQGDSFRLSVSHRAAVTRPRGHDQSSGATTPRHTPQIRGRVTIDTPLNIIGWGEKSRTVKRVCR